MPSGGWCPHTGIRRHKRLNKKGEKMKYIGLNQSMQKAIQERAYFERPYCALRSIMNAFQMDSYRKLCESRIIYEVGVDGKDIICDFVNVDILLNYHGLRKSRKVLESYLNDEQLEQILDYAASLDGMAVNRNNILWMLRSWDRNRLEKYMEENNSFTGKEELENYIRCEFQSRNLLNRACRRLQEAAGEWAFQIKYFSRIMLVKKILREIPETKPTGKDRPVLIKRNYEKYRSIPEGKRTADEWKKYVYYGIRHYTRNKNSGPAKVCYQIEENYKAMTDIIKAASRLTPEEFMSLFPPDKEYNGEKYMEKDYFTTMKAVKRFPAGKPIGKEINCFLEEYYSKYVFFFWVNYFSCMGDYDVYCGISDPVENYFRQIKRFHASGWDTVQEG